MNGLGERRTTWALLGIILVAFFLRMYRIDAPCLRGDEAFSITYARQSVPEMLRHFTTSTEPHPPLSFFVLHYWGRLAGESELALRFTSAFAGLLVVPLIYVLGRLLFDARVGIVAAALLAFNPFYIWHAQEARMYGMLAAFSIASRCFRIVPVSPRAIGPVKPWGIPTRSILAIVPRSSGRSACVASSGATSNVCHRSVASLTSVTM